jgi:hypothetical protein
MLFGDKGLGCLSSDWGGLVHKLVANDWGEPGVGVDFEAAALVESAAHPSGGLHLAHRSRFA